MGNLLATGIVCSGHMDHPTNVPSRAMNDGNHTMNGKIELKIELTEKTARERQETGGGSNAITELLHFPA
jgi:hypothetical protein